MRTGTTFETEPALPRTATTHRWVALAVAVASMASPASAQDGTGSAWDDDLFPALLAAPREIQSYFTVLWWETATLDSRVASMGVGDALPLARWGTAERTVGRLAVEYAVLAQFDLDGPSFDFVNADFFVGLPVSLRRGRTSVRLRFYHWSAHLGDEFLLRSGLEREEVSVEALEILVARRWGPARLLGGAVRRTRRFPKALSPSILRVGGELAPSAPWTRAGWLGEIRPLVGLDVRWTDIAGPRGWSAGVSGTVGLEFRPVGPGRRAFAVVVEGFDGLAPYGQFFRDDLRTVGVGLRLR